jgi:hypothetical protein
VTPSDFVYGLGLATILALALRAHRLLTQLEALALEAERAVSARDGGGR